MLLSLIYCRMHFSIYVRVFRIKRKWNFSLSKKKSMVLGCSGNVVILCFKSSSISPSSLAMRVVSHSYWLAIFWATNSSPLLPRKRLQNSEYVLSNYFIKITLLGKGQRWWQGPDREHRLLSDRAGHRRRPARPVQVRHQQDLGRDLRPQGNW